MKPQMNREQPSHNQKESHRSLTCAAHTQSTWKCGLAVLGKWWSNSVAKRAPVYHPVRHGRDARATTASCHGRPGHDRTWPICEPCVHQLDLVASSGIFGAETRRTRRVRPWERTLPARPGWLTPSTQDACAPRSTQRKILGSLQRILDLVPYLCSCVLRSSAFPGRPGLSGKYVAVFMKSCT